MIKVSVLYPYSESKDFNMEYYCEKHMPMDLILIPIYCGSEM